ncbi:hypothetical protein [Agromyces sp. Leaf222]|uniref:hypothetical protein n=1 Tax=Agromyces sp. Leaf222 TaxID=1735688 RepID=UPI0006FBAE71|nr:hypothetical protein [Agromyces sp. Leaf222]KQM84050.1 hypothetical protein ASE68_13270 [Agromyces sp. Leaf222]
MSPDPTTSPDPAERPDPAGLAHALAHEADAASPRRVDLDAVLRGSRERRRHRRRAVVGATASVAGVLVVGALAFGVGSMVPRAATTADSSAADSSTADGAAESPAELGGDAASGGSEAVAPQDGAQFGDDALVVGPDALNRCGETIAAASDAADGPLTAVLVSPPGPVSPGAEGVVRVRVVNEGPTVVEASLRMVPSITVSEAGRTVWHPSFALDAPLVPVRLAPGEQVELEGRFTAASCTAADEEDGAIAVDLPPLSPGAYELSAVVLVEPTGAGPVLVVSPTAPVTIG